MLRGALLLLFSMFAFPTQGEALIERAYKIKAGYIYNFVRYTKFANEEDTIEVCSKSSMFIDLAIEVLGDKRANEKEISYHYIDDDYTDCDVLFVTEQDTSWWTAQSYQLTKPFSPLVIGESTGFAKQLGHINFMLVANKVRFEINPGNLKQSGLSMSSAVLRIAKVIE